MMAGIRSRNTKPELRVRRGLHARGFRFRIHSINVPGSPDLILPRFKTAVFVHGCYWHGHDCSLFRIPASNRDFWMNKFDRNRERDIVVQRQVDEAGWRQLVIWECAFRGRGQIGEAAAIDAAASFILGDERHGEVRGAS